MASYRTIWISDLHLGTSACRASDLLGFLEEVSADRIYLVGDIIDLEQMKTRASLREPHMRVISRLIELNDRSSEVVYVPGNHDAEIRKMANRHVFGIPVLKQAVHTTAGGCRLLIMHGDEFDHELRDGSPLQRFGSFAYESIMGADVLVNRVRRVFGQTHVPISANVKNRLSAVNDFIERFETMAARFAAERQYDGIICGHIHKPVIKRLESVVYANDGDWVEHGSALAETRDGTLTLLNWGHDSVQAGQLSDTTPIAA